jgi:hypothetical protein
MRVRRARSPLTRHPFGAPRWSRLAGATALSLTACRTAAPSNAVQPVPANPSGTASYEAVVEPGPDISKQVSQRLFLPAVPGDENRPPLYPEELLGLALPPQRIVVRLTLDEHGHITGVTTNASASEADPRYRTAFESAIRIAVDRWSFRPAAQRIFVDSPSDGSGKPPYKVLQSETPVPTYLDLRFIFEMTNGEGIVRQTH